METHSKEPSETEIAALAHRLWAEAGRPEGHDLDHWRRAEAHLRMEESDELASEHRNFL